MDKKLAVLDMGYGRIITGLITMPDSLNYYEVQIVDIENPIKNDWKTNEVIKISKSVINNIQWKN